MNRRENPQKKGKGKGRLFVRRLIVWSLLSNLVRQVFFTHSHDDVTNRDVTISVQLLVKGSSSIKTQNWILIEFHPVPISIKSSRPTLRKISNWINVRVQVSQMTLIYLCGKPRMTAVGKYFGNSHFGSNRACSRICSTSISLEFVPSICSIDSTVDPT